MNARLRQVRRVLVVLPNWLGDVVMATPLLDLLARAQDRGGRPLEILACVRRRWAPLVTRDPRLAGLIPYERTGKDAGPVGVCRLAAAWRRAAPGAVVLCPPSLRMGLVARLARIPVRVGARSDGRGPLLTVPVGMLRPRGRSHHSEELRRLGSALLADLRLPEPPPLPCRPSLPGLRDLAAAHLGQGPALWVVAPGAAFGPAKTWPAARVAEFLELAVVRQGRRVAVVGDASAAAAAAELRLRTPHLAWRREAPGPAGIVDLVGATTVLDLAALLKAAEAFVGNDSGAMHLAAALGVPTVGLFGSTSAAWTGPRGERAVGLSADGFACQPCFRRTCNQRVFCLDTVAGRDVLAALERLLERPAPEARR